MTELDLRPGEGFQIEGSRAARIAHWRERQEAKAFEELTTRLRRKLLERGVCRFCGREIPLIAGELGSVTRYHRDLTNGPCVGRGRAPA